MDSYTAPPLAKFFPLPDGTLSTVQVDTSTSSAYAQGADPPPPRPVAVNTPEQLAQWAQIQDAGPLTLTERATQLAARMARPLFSADAEADEGTGGSLLDGLRMHAELDAATTVTAEVGAASRTQGEYDQRVNAACQLAASLGLALVWVRDDPAMKVPAHLEVRDAAGLTNLAGDLPALETALRTLARERAVRDAKIARWESHGAQLAAEQAERIASLPENKLRRLEAALAAQGITV